MKPIFPFARYPQENIDLKRVTIGKDTNKTGIELNSMRRTLQGEKSLSLDKGASLSTSSPILLSLSSGSNTI